jgi:hypothetical protein
LGVPVGLVPGDRGLLINYVELLVRVYVDVHFDGNFLRRRYYSLLCDAYNRSRWRFVVKEDFCLPLSFTPLLGYRARMQYYPSRLFDPAGGAFLVYYCGFVRSFMRCVADSLARSTGLMGSARDDIGRFGARLRPVTVVRLNCHDRARLSLDGSLSGWCPDVFDGLGAHECPAWFRRAAPVARYAVGGYDPSFVECLLLRAFVTDICRRLPGLFRYPLFADLLAGFLNFLEDGEGRDDYLLGCGLCPSIELIVLRSGMLLGDHWGFLRWLGASLPPVGATAGAFTTPPAFLGANLSMQNFGAGGHVATIVLTNTGRVVPMSLGGINALGFCDGRLVYGIHPFVGEVVELTDIFTGEPV